MDRKSEQQTNSNKNTGVIDLIIGLPFLCNPNLIADFLFAQLRQTYLNLLSGSNERDEVLNCLNAIPDGCEREVAGFINNAVDIMGKKKKRRSLDEKVSTKPHLHMVSAIKIAKNVFTR